MHDPENEYTIISDRGVEKGVLEGNTLKVTSKYRKDDPAIWMSRDRVLLMKTIEDEKPACRLVLCWCKDSAQFTVWWENTDVSERVGYPATFQGDYFPVTNFRAALDKFLQRADKAGLKVLAVFA